MLDSPKIEALRLKIEELETQEAGERKKIFTWFEKLKHQHEVKTLQNQQLQDQELYVLAANGLNFNGRLKSLFQRHMFLLNAYNGAKSVTFDGYISDKDSNLAQSQIKSIREEAETKMEVLQSESKMLLAENNFNKDTVVSLNNNTSASLEEIGKFEARVNTLTMDVEMSSTKIQELETPKEASDNALHESIWSLSKISALLQEVQSEYGAEKERIEDERNDFNSEITIRTKKLKKMEEEQEAKQREEEEEMVRSSVQPRNNTPEGEASSAIFTTITCIESTCKYKVKTGYCCYRYGLDTNKYNVLAVVDDWKSVYLYSETNEREEKLCTCQYGIYCLAWNQQGTLLAIGGEHNNNTNKTIQVWDIPNRRIIKRLKIEDNKQDCRSLDWKGDTITAGTDQYIYQWNINDQDNDQDTQGNKTLVPRKTILNKHGSSIRTVQWSNCKSKLATITEYGDMCIYDDQFKLISNSKAHNNRSFPLLQWCPWDNQVITTCCWKEGYLKIWRVQQDITLFKKVKHKSRIVNVKWIPSKKAILTAHQHNQLVLWEYPSLGIIQTISGHTDTPWYLAISADKSALVSKSNKEMIFWKPFDQFSIQSSS